MPLVGQTSLNHKEMGNSNGKLPIRRIHPMPSAEKLLEEEKYEQAFNVLVEEQSDFLLRNILRWVRQEDQARDVLQNTYIRIWKGLASFRAEAQISSWCYRIAFNESMAFLRSRKRILQLEQAEAGVAVAPDEGPDAEEIQRKLQFALEQLPERQRQVFELRYYEEMPYEEMAALLELSVGSLKASFHHARKKIESHLREGN